MLADLLVNLAAAKTVGETQEAMNKIIASVTDKLTQLGVQQNDIVTSSYSYYPVYNYDTDTPTIKGYQANHTLCITCNDVEMLDSVVGAVTDSGMSDIYSVSYAVAVPSAVISASLPSAKAIAGIASIRASAKARIFFMLFSSYSKEQAVLFVSGLIWNILPSPI